MFQTGTMLTETAPIAGIALLAHQGGWDELLMVAAPVVLVAGLLILANRRAKAALAERLAHPDGAPSPAESGPPALDEQPDVAEQPGDPGQRPPAP